MEDTIRTFRFMRDKRRAGEQARSKTKERLGLAERRIAETSYEAKRMADQTKQSLRQVYDPAQSINEWADEIETIRKERAEMVGTISKNQDTPQQPTNTPRGNPGQGSPYSDFISRLAQSESGGNYSAANDEGFVGLLQFGQPRLDDYNRAHGTSITTAQFKADPDLQDTVNDWHIADIDKAIDRLNAQGYNRDGLRAVAHLGGIGGMQKFVRTGGKYNPADSNNTSLNKYYRRFSS